MRDVLLVTQKGDHSLGYYDLESGVELGRTSIDPFPHEFALSPDRRFAYCCHFGLARAEDEGAGGNTVSVVELATQRRVGTIDCGIWRRPHGISIDRQGRLYVLSEGASSLLIVDEVHSGRPTAAIATAGNGSHIVSVSLDGSKAFCSNIRSETVTVVFPGDPDRTPAVISVGKRPEGSAFDTEERLLYVANRESDQISVIDVHGLTLTRTIATAPGPVRICLDGTGALLVAFYHHRAVGRLDPNGNCLALVNVPGAPISIAFHEPSRTVLASLHGEADVVVLIDLDSFCIRATVATRSDPDPVVVVQLPL